MHSRSPQGDPRSDADLISAVRSGDPAAFGVLYSRHHAAVTAMARYYARDDFTADDLVSEAFERTLGVMSAGGGPDVSFRAYIYTAVRRLSYEHNLKGRKTKVTDDFAEFEIPEEFVDPAVVDFERTLVAGAFAGLPERWQAVLWYVEVESMSPAEVAPLLGLTANGVSALAYRAREGLRESYLQGHVVAAPPKPACEEFRGRLGPYARGGLGKRENTKIENHLDTCEECAPIVAELRHVDGGMRAVMGPLILGAIAAAGLGFGSPSAGSATAAVIALAPRAAWHPSPVVAAIASVAAVALVATVVVFAVSPGAEPPAASTQSEPTSPPTLPATSAPTANPTPTITATPAPTASPSVRAQPDAPAQPQTPTQPPAPQPTISIAMSDVGDLVLGRDGMVGVTVSNTGKGGASDVSFTVSLPSGVAIDPTRALSSQGTTAWSCSPVASGLSCSAATVAPGQSLSVYVPVTVASTASQLPVTAAVSASGQVTQLVRSTRPVMPRGLGTRYLANGSYATTTSGASFLSCDVGTAGCADARAKTPGSLIDNGSWPMVAVDEASTGVVSSSTQLAIPAGATVTFAGLYWSGITPSGASDAELGSLSLAAPHGASHPVTADRVDRAALNFTDCYQSYADVTDIVAAGGAGLWTASGARVTTGVGAYAGWSLVVVYADPSLSPGRVTVFDGFEPVVTAPVSFSVAGLPDTMVTASLVAWEGDAGLTGDSISLGGTVMTRASGAGDANNAFDSTAAGSAIPNSFGVDVGPFVPVRVGPARSLLTAATTDDVYLIGVVTTSAR